MLLVYIIRLGRLQPMNEYRFEEIYIGQKESFTREITSDMEDMFRIISGDDNPLHRDDKFAKQVSKGKFDRHAVFGMLTASMYSTFAGMYMPGKYSLIHGFDELSFIKPVFVGDVLTVTGEVTDKEDSLGLIKVKIVIKNQNCKMVSRARIKILVLE